MSKCDLALVLLCMGLAGIFSVAGDEGSDYLDRKEQDVEEIVRLAITNARQQCGLLAACGNPTNCSHDACSMEQMRGSKCMSGFNNQFCSYSGTSTNTSCNTMNLDFSTSYTRNAESTNLNSVDSMLAICSQKLLEPLFKTISNASVPSRARAYYAATTGSYRVYPGTPQNAYDCTRFDPRTRPWYRTATSVVKIVVVFIDLGASMGNNLPPDLGAGTILQAAKNMAKALLLTLSAQDYINIIAFDSSRVIQLSPSPILVKEHNGTEATELDILRTELDKLTIEGQNRPSNISAAMLAALPIFDANPQAAKVILVLTDTVFALGSNVTVPTAELLNSKVKVFMYKLKQPQDNDVLLKNSSLILELCAVGGHFEPIVKNLENPLLAFRHYYSYLANLKRILTNGRPQYSQLYQNFEPAFVGDIVTVSKPVFVEGDLIGVAGISIYIDSLGNITAQVKQALASRITGYTLAAPEIVLNAANCSLVNETLQPCGSSTAYYAEDGGLCKRDDSRRRTMQELMCCGTCSAAAPTPESGGLSPAAIGGVVAGGVVGIVVLFLFLLQLRSKIRRPKVPPPVTEYNYPGPD